jgi:hypothetical protein
MPRLSQQIPGPPTCAFCGSTGSDRYVGGYGNHICRECIAQPAIVEPAGQEATCALCGEPAYGHRGLPGRQVVPVTSKRGAVLCSECQHVAEEIMAENPTSPPG